LHEPCSFSPCFRSRAILSTAIFQSSAFTHHCTCFRAPEQFFLLPLFNPQLSHTIALVSEHQIYPLCHAWPVSAKEQDIIDRLLWPVLMATKSFHGIKSRGMMALQDFICIPPGLSQMNHDAFFYDHVWFAPCLSGRLFLCFAGRRRDTGVRTPLLRTQDNGLFSSLLCYKTCSWWTVSYIRAKVTLLSFFNSALLWAKKMSIFVGKKNKQKFLYQICAYTSPTNLCMHSMGSELWPPRA
jgi:hypothetical protein